MANPILEQVYAGEFVLSEGPRTRSRDTIVIAQSQTLVAGQILGYSSVGTLAGAFSAEGTNTGNPTCGAITVAAGTDLGEFDIVMDDATHFHVLDPAGEPIGTGEEDGHGVFGTAFAQGG